MQCELIENPSGLVLKVMGQFTQTEVEEFDKQTREVAARKPALLVLDMSGLTIITSAGIGSLLRLQRTFHTNKCAIRMAALPAEIYKVLELSRLTDIFRVSPTVSDALS